MKDYGFEIKELSDEISARAPNEAECFPIDRYFLNEFIERIQNVDKFQFLLYNLENINNTYTVQLLLCLPELWEDISIMDVEDLIKKFTNIFSFYAFIIFTYRYIEINIIDLIFRTDEVAVNHKKNIKDYLQTQYPNLLKSETDYFFFDEGLYGVSSDSWVYVKQKLLLEKGVEPALKSIGELENYVKSLSP